MDKAKTDPGQHDFMPAGSRFYFYYVLVRHARRGCISSAGKQPFQPFFGVRPGVRMRGVQSPNPKKCPIYGLSEGVQKY